MELFNTQYRLIFGLCSLIAFIIATILDVKKRNIKNQLQIVAIVLVVLLFLFGLRGALIGSDTNAYIFQFENVDDLSPDREVIFYYLTKFLHKFISAQGFIFFIAAVYLGALYVYIKNKPAQVSKFLLFFAFFSMFFFKTLGFNVVRQGVSLMFFLLAYQKYEKKKMTQSAILLFVSLCWHTTTLLAVPFVFLSTRKINHKVLLISYFMVLVLSYANFGLLNIMPFLSNLNQYDKRIGAYVIEEVNELYTVGFKPQFALFNSFFLILAFYIRKNIINKQDPDEQKRYYSYIIYFTLSSMLFFMSFQIPYSDRIGLLSWIMIPSLLEPLISTNKKKYATFGWLLCFMLFIIFEFVLS